MLEVFNTLLRQLRLSIDYALTGSYDCTAGVSTKIIKEHEERMFQEAVIKTIGGASCGAWRCAGVGAFCLCISGRNGIAPVLKAALGSGVYPLRGCGLSPGGIAAPAIPGGAAV